jgi:hypothetical protein
MKDVFSHLVFVLLTDIVHQMTLNIEKSEYLKKSELGQKVIRSPFVVRSMTIQMKRIGVSLPRTAVGTSALV